MTTELKRKCEVFGRTIEGNISFGLDPGTDILACKKHYQEMHGDPGSG